MPGIHNQSANSGGDMSPTRARPLREAERKVYWEREAARRLSEINSQLTGWGLRPLLRIGDYRKGEWEIVKIHDHYANPYYWIVCFEIRQPKTGNPGRFYVKFHSSGATQKPSIIVPMYNGKFVLLRQARLPTAVLDGAHQFTTAFPRQFANRDLLPTMVDRKLEAAFGSDEPEHMSSVQSLAGSKLLCVIKHPDVEIRSLSSLSTVVRKNGARHGVLENDGEHAVELDYWLLKMTGPPEVEKMEGPDGMRLRFFAPDEIILDPFAHGVFDQATLSGLFLVCRAMNAIDPSKIG